MRRITTLKLNNDKNISVVADTSSPNESKKLAIKNSKRLFRDEALIVTKSSHIVSDEVWEKERNSHIQSNSKLYYTAFFLNNVTQMVTINANSIKSAYNNVKIKYGLQDNIFMMIYEATQSNKRKSAVTESKETLNNKDRLRGLFSIALNKIAKTEYRKYRNDIRSVLSIIRDCVSNRYKYIDTEMIYCATAIIIYFNNPYDYILDISDLTSSMTDKQAIIYLIDNFKNEIHKYEKWEKAHGNIVEVN